METDTELPVIARVRALITPIATDLALELYDLEQRGRTLRITLDTPAGSPSGITLDVLALASRLVSKELDQHDPIPSRYTLEVTSPGVERALRRPAHFHREIGKVVTIRLANVGAEQRRVEGVLVAAGDEDVTVETPDGSHVVRYVDIDRAKTVFEWGGQPKPGGRRTDETPASDTASASDEADAAPGHREVSAEPARSAAPGHREVSAEPARSAAPGHSEAAAEPAIRAAEPAIREESQ